MFYSLANSRLKGAPIARPVLNKIVRHGTEPVIMFGGQVSHHFSLLITLLLPLSSFPHFFLKPCSVCLVSFSLIAKWLRLLSSGANLYLYSHVLHQTLLPMLPIVCLQRPSSFSI